MFALIVSISLSLIGRYLLFTLMLVTLSIAFTIMVLNVNFRSSATCQMSSFTRLVFLRLLPRLLRVRQLSNRKTQPFSTTANTASGFDSRRASSLCESALTSQSESTSTTAILPEEHAVCSSKAKRSKVKFASDSTFQAATVCAASVSVALLDKENCALHANLLRTADSCDLTMANHLNMTPNCILSQRNVTNNESSQMQAMPSNDPLFCNPPFLKRRGELLEKALLNLRYLIQHLKVLDSNHEVSGFLLYNSITYKPFLLKIIVYFLLLFNCKRWKKVGSSLPWFWIVCFFAYSVWCVCQAPRLSYCKLQLFTIHKSLLTYFYPKSVQGHSFCDFSISSSFTLLLFCSKDVQMFV